MHRAMQLFICCCILMLIICLVADSRANTLHAKQPISLSYQNIKVRDLLQMIGKFSKKNLIISNQITGNITLELNKVTWEQALAVLLRVQGLSKIETQNVIYIAPGTQTSQFEAQQDKLPVAIKLHYAQAQELEKILKPTGILSANSGISSDPRTNTLVINDVTSRTENIGQLIHAIDLPLKQVLIEARIVCVDDDFARELGAKFGTLQKELETKNRKNNSYSPLESLEPGKIDITILKLLNMRTLDLELAALEKAGKAKVISSPKLFTIERQTAYIESGSEIPYQEKTSGGATNVAFKKAVLSLQVTPEILSNNKINLALELNQDKVSQLTVNGVPAIDTRKIATQVTVQNKETVVLGGIYEWATGETITQVPYLSKIPLLGLLFTNKEKKLQRKQLLMFVTPQIIE